MYNSIHYKYLVYYERYTTFILTYYIEYKLLRFFNFKINMTLSNKYFKNKYIVYKSLEAIKY